MWFLILITLLIGAANLYITHTKLNRLKQRLGLAFAKLQKEVAKKPKKPEPSTLARVEDLLNRIEGRLNSLQASVETSIGKASQAGVENEGAWNVSRQHGLVPVANRPDRFAPRSRRIESLLGEALRPEGNPRAHSDREVTLETLGKVDNSYAPTYDGFGDYIDGFHRGLPAYGVNGLISSIHEVEGKLKVADTLKIYELAYFSPGNILELGCFKGLSTCIESAANHASGLRKEIYTIDFDRALVEKARGNLERQALGTNVISMVADATDGIQILHKLGHQFTFAFVDHSHAYEHVFPALQAIQAVLAPGAFLLFHDYYDRRNFDDSNTDYDVIRAIRDANTSGQFVYWGCYGSCGLYRYLP